MFTDLICCCSERVCRTVPEQRDAAGLRRWKTEGQRSQIQTTASDIKCSKNNIMRQTWIWRPSDQCMQGFLFFFQKGDTFCVTNHFPQMWQIVSINNWSAVIKPRQIGMSFLSVHIGDKDTLAGRLSQTLPMNKSQPVSFKHCCIVWAYI